MCGGLAIGDVAATAGLAWLREKRALDEELVAIVETDACCVDAIQVLTGCNFGKGNLVYRDYGKIGFTFFNRRTGQEVRLAMKPDAFRVNDRQIDPFSMTPVTAGMPDRARIEPSTPCARCSEPTMASKLALVDGQAIYRGVSGRE